jgi:hypothetical protein
LSSIWEFCYAWPEIEKEGEKMTKLVRTCTEHGEDENGNRVKVLKISRDHDPMNPREEWDNFGKMVCWHSRYNLGDSHKYSTPRDFVESLAVDFGMDPDKANDAEDEKLWLFVEKHGFFLPLYLYDHSGITMNTGGFSCPWDSGQVGYIYATPEMIRENWGVKHITKKIREKAIALLEAEVKTYDDFLTGNVWGYECIDESGDVVDSCWGFYGSDIKENGMLESIPEEYRKLEPIYV